MVKRIAVILALIFLPVAVYAQLDKVDALLQKLNSTDLVVRENTIRELGRTNDSRAIEPLFTIVLNKDDKCRSFAANALGQISDSKVADRLISELNNDKDKDLDSVFYPVLALMSSKDPRAVEFFNEALKEKRLEIIAANYEYYIRKGEPGTENILIQSMNKYGDDHVIMVLNFLNCGNVKLSLAAKKWMTDKKGSTKFYYPYGSPSWGGKGSCLGESY